jgi:hypothetical protein
MRVNMRVNVCAQFCMLVCNLHLCSCIHTCKRKYACLHISVCLCGCVSCAQLQVHMHMFVFVCIEGAMMRIAQSALACSSRALSCAFDPHGHKCVAHTYARFGLPRMRLNQQHHASHYYTVMLAVPMAKIVDNDGTPTCTRQVMTL